EMEASAAAKNYVQALEQLRTLKGKVEEYEKALEELEQQEKAFQEAWAALQEKMTPTEQSQFKKLEPQQQELTEAKTEIETAAQEEDYEKALNLVNELDKKVDPYLEAAKKLEEQKKAYFEARKTAQDAVDNTPQELPYNDKNLQGDWKALLQ